MGGPAWPSPGLMPAKHAAQESKALAAQEPLAQVRARGPRSRRCKPSHPLRSTPSAQPAPMVPLQCGGWTLQPVLELVGLIFLQAKEREAQAGVVAPAAQSSREATQTGKEGMSKSPTPSQRSELESPMPDIATPTKDTGTCPHFPLAIANAPHPGPCWTAPFPPGLALHMGQGTGQPHASTVSPPPMEAGEPQAEREKQARASVPHSPCRCRPGAGEQQ